MVDDDKAVHNTKTKDLLTSLGAQLEKEIQPSTIERSGDDKNHLNIPKKLRGAGESSPPAEKSSELVQAIVKATASKDATAREVAKLAEDTKLDKVMRKAILAFRRYKRQEQQDQNAEGKTWAEALRLATHIVEGWKKQRKQPRTEAKTKQPQSNSSNKNSCEPEQTRKNYANRQYTGIDAHSSLPNTVSEYRNRLIRGHKELHKDPPVLPPSLVQVDSKWYGEPKQRDKHTGKITFVAGDDGSSQQDLKKMLRDFHPNKTPQEILQAGAFGGTYFRPIVSAVTNQSYDSKQVLQDTVPTEWLTGVDVDTMVTSSKYRAHVNKYGVSCGGSLGMWESSGWISNIDPYGWFQWYCRFYQGRRCSDDGRQISRWLKIAGPKGRFRSQLCNKILAASSSSTTKNLRASDASISPVIRQTLLHWGLEITEDILQQHFDRVSKK